MRLARDQEHPQPVAHAGDGGDDPVVAVGQLALPGAEADVDHVGAAMADLDHQRGLLAHRQHMVLRRPAVDRHLDGDLALGHRRPLHPGDQAEGHALADDAEARRVGRLQRQVEAAALAGDQGMDRAGEALQPVGVVDLAVGQQHRAGDLAGGNMGGRLVQRGQEPGAFVLAGLVGRQLDHPELQRVGRGGERLDPGPQPLGGVGYLGRAILQGGRLGAVDHEEGDVLQPLTLLALELRPGQRQHQDAQGHRPQRPSRQAAPERQQGAEQYQRRQCADRFPVELGEKGQGEVHHCPSLSRTAGACTWSDL